MSYIVTQGDILSVQADAAVLGLEMTMHVAEDPAGLRLAEAGGEALREAIRRQRFIAVGSAAAAGSCTLPFAQILLTAIPRWLTGKANELLALRRCYESIFALAAEHGCRRVVTPFLSALYYHFPQPEAVHVALTAAERTELEVVFLAETPELLALSREPYRRAQIVSYIGYYRDHALFALDNGLYARVDLRPEIEYADTIPYFEACYREGNDPLRPRLPESEIARLRQIWENGVW